MRQTLAAALLLTQTQTVYYFAMLGVALDYPKTPLLLLVLIEWLATMRLLDKVKNKALRRGLAVWLTFSPIFLLPSAIALWKATLFGLNPTHLIPAALTIPFIFAAKRTLKPTLLAALSLVAAYALLTLGVVLQTAAPIYLSATLSAAGGLAATTTPLRSQIRPQIN